MQTPWGPSQGEDKHSADIVFYSTLGHGGYHVTGAAAKHMRADFPAVWNIDNFSPEGWFEEDCGWAAVALCFPLLFDGWSLGNAINTARDTWDADVFEAHMLTPAGKGSVVMAKDWIAHNADKWEQLGFCDGSDGVTIPARRVGDGARCEVTWGAEVRRQWMELKGIFTLDDARSLGATVMVL